MNQDHLAQRSLSQGGFGTERFDGGPRHHDVSVMSTSKDKTTSLILSRTFVVWHIVSWETKSSAFVTTKVS